MLIYSLILHIRHLFYDKGWIKSSPTGIPSVCVGNVAVGGTGKTPMAELIIRTLKEDEAAPEDGFFGSLFGAPPKSVAVVSRGYRRKTRGLQEVQPDGTAALYGDEPLQIKRKFPEVKVIVDSDRVEACEKLKEHKGSTDIIILDDAFQHRKIIPTRSIVLTTYSRPFFKDRLLPFGKLRDLPSRVKTADMIVVTKCPPYLDEWERSKWARNVGLRLFDLKTCTGVNEDGKRQTLLFSTMVYDKMQPVFSDGDPRYTHSKLAILFSGIANDEALAMKVKEEYKLLMHRRFPDHHFYTQGNVDDIESVARHNATAVVITTEKDAQRLMDADFSKEEKKAHRIVISPELRKRLFYAPIRTCMLTPEEHDIFKAFLNEI